jgi:DNA modification methylase
LQLDTISRCLELWSNKKDVILSPFAGIGSEGYQAIQMDRKFIGIELKTSYFKEAVKNLKRIESAPVQKELFE